MKSEKDLKGLIPDLEKQINEDTNQRRISSAIKRIKYYQQLVKYLQSKPNELFLQSERERLQFRIDAFMKHYQPLNDGRFTKKELTAHRNVS